MRKDWIEVELEEVCTINMGQSPPSSTYNTNGNGLPFFQGKAEFTDLYPKVEKWCSSPKKTASINDILLSVRAPVGSTNIADQTCAIGRGLAAISYPRCFKYIWFYLILIEKKLDSQGTGTTFRAISGSVLKSQVIPIPPLPEQQAIVSKIEKLFSELDHSIASFKAAKAKLKIYHHAVLKKAFDGGFTGNNQKGSELPQGWVIKMITDLVKKEKNALKAGPFGSSLKKAFYTEAGYKIYGQEQVIKGDPFYGDYFINKSKFEELKSCKVEAGDILISLVGTVGKVLILPENALPGIINPRLIKITLDKETYNPKFFKYYFESSKVKSIYKMDASGTTMDVLNLGLIKKIPFPFPPNIKEQVQIVQEIESRLSVSDKLAETIEINLKKSEALRQSILKKAFEGKLLSEPELEACRKEADWEPAEKLLERIKEEKRKSKK